MDDKIVLKLSCIILSVFALRSRGDILLVQNGYEGLTVAISEKVPQDLCNQVVHGIKNVFTQFSKGLWKTTEGRASLRDVTVSLPKTWQTSTLTCSLLSQVESVAPPISSHVHITVPHPVFGSKPWTQQSQGCGRPGDYIQMGFMPISSSSNETLMAIVDQLIREWAKFRWGVFEESGHDGDSLFPMFYLDPVLHDLKRNECPLENSQAPFCSTSDHVPETPNKHNTQCGGRPAYNIIMQSSDFADGRNAPNGTEEPLVPKFNFIQESAPRFVLAVEDTAVMNLQRRWEFVRKALRRVVVYDIPDGAYVALIVFNSVARTLAPLAKLDSTSDVRQRLGSSLPRNPSTVPESHKCLLCGIQEALRALDSDGIGSSGANIILITTGAGAATYHQMDEIVRLIKIRKVRITPIFYPLTERPGSVSSISNSLEPLVQASNERGQATRIFTIMDEGVGNDSKVSMMVALMDALLAAVRLSGPPNAMEAPIIVHSESYQGGIASMSTGKFELDDSFGPNARLSIYYYDLNHVGNTIQLTTPSSKIMASVNMQEEDGDANVIFVNIPDAERGQWKYKLENRADSHQGLHVQVTAFPNNNRKIETRVWTNYVGSTINASDPSLPLLVFAELKDGGSPILNARVVAKLQRLGINTSGIAYKPIYVDLFDNGYGDPDITKGDGIYSRYLPQMLTFAGYYELSIMVDHNSGHAVYPVMETLSRQPHFYDRDRPSCCGSSIKYDQLRPTSPFSRVITYGVLNVISSGSSQDNVPPSKILNLRAVLNESSNTVTLYWTAPGDDYDWGRAQSYEAVTAASWPEARAFNGERLTGLPVPLMVNTEQSHTFKATRFGAMSYVAIRGVDATKNRGGISNIAAFWQPLPPTTDAPVTFPYSDTPTSNAAEALGHGLTQPVRVAGLALEDMAVVIGSVGGFLIIVTVVAAFCYCHVSHRRKQQQKKDTNKMEGNRNVMIKTNSTVRIDQDDTRDSVDSTVKDDEALKDGRPLSPVQSWAASKLLAEHERRFSVTSGPVIDHRIQVVQYGVNLQDPFPDVTLTGTHSYPSSQTPSTTHSDPPAYQPAFTAEGYAQYPYPYHQGFVHEDLPPYTSSQSSQASTAYAQEMVGSTSEAPYPTEVVSYANEIPLFMTNAYGDIQPAMQSAFNEIPVELQSPQRSKVPPPVAPKPQIRSAAGGSSEPKRRNVTQV